MVRTILHCTRAATEPTMPRLTAKVFTDLAIWMTAFGLLIGLVFPLFCLALGLPVDRVLSPLFFASTVTAGLLVGGVNFGLARLVVGRRLRRLATTMETVEEQLAGAMVDHDWSGCDPERCALPVDSADEVGAAASAFNRLIRTLARSHQVEAATGDFTEVVASHLELDELDAASLDALLRNTGASAGALLAIRDEELVPLASHGLRAVERIGSNDHVRRALRTGAVARIEVDPDLGVIDSLLVDQVAREVVVAPVAFKGVPLGAVVLASIAPFAADVAVLVDQFRTDLGLALNNALTHDRLQRLAALDPLTDAYNRRFGLGRLREEFARAVRSGSPLGVLMLDLDRFKARQRHVRAPGRRPGPPRRGRGVPAGHPRGRRPGPLRRRGVPRPPPRREPGRPRRARRADPPRDRGDRRAGGRAAHRRDRQRRRRHRTRRTTSSRTRPLSPWPTPRSTPRSTPAGTSSASPDPPFGRIHLGRSRPRPGSRFRFARLPRPPVPEGEREAGSID